MKLVTGTKRTTRTLTFLAAFIGTFLFLGASVHAAEGRSIASKRPVEPSARGILHCDIDPGASTVCYSCKSESLSPERDRNCRRINS